MNRTWFLACMTLCLVTSALSAQQASQPQSTPGRNGRRPMGGGGRGDMVAWFLQDATDNVGLAEDQKKLLQESLNKLRQEAIEQFRSNPPDRSMWQTMRALRQQQEQAAVAGDETKVEEIQKQLDSQDPAAMFRQMRSRAMGEVEKVLTADQQEAFDQWRAVRESNLPPPLANDPEALKTAISGIQTLTTAQRSMLQAVYVRYSERVASVSQDDTVERNRLRNQMALDLQGVLKPGQQVLMMSNFRQQMRQRFQAGRASQPAGQPAPTETSSTAAVAQAPTAVSPQPPAISPVAIPTDTDAWTAYVRNFETANDLDEPSRQTADNILHELRTRRDAYMSSHRTDLAEVDRKAKAAASQVERAAAEQDRKTIQKPVEDMFQELKDRLEPLAPVRAAATTQASQPAAPSRTAVASQAATANHPAGESNPRASQSRRSRHAQTNR